MGNVTFAEHANGSGWSLLVDSPGSGNFDESHQGPSLVTIERSEEVVFLYSEPDFRGRCLILSGRGSHDLSQKHLVFNDVPRSFYVMPSDNVSFITCFSEVMKKDNADEYDIKGLQPVRDSADVVRQSLLGNERDCYWEYLRWKKLDLVGALLDAPGEGQWFCRHRHKVRGKVLYSVDYLPGFRVTLLGLLSGGPEMTISLGKVAGKEIKIGSNLLRSLFEKLGSLNWN